MKKLAAFAAVGLAWLIAYAAAAVMLSVTIQNTGNITTPPNLSASPSTISWGNLDAGASTTRTVTLTSTGAIGTLGMTSTGLPSFLTLTWNCTGVALAAGQQVTALFTLQASTAAPQGTFAFNITVTCTSP